MSSNAKQRLTLTNLNEPQQMRELNRQLTWVWDQLLGGLSMKSLNTGTRAVIDSKAEGSEVDALGNQVAKNASAISQTPDMIRMAVENVRVGGVNMAAFKQLAFSNSSDTEAGALMDATTETYRRSGKIARMYAHEGGASGYSLAMFGEIGLEVGKEYTLSFRGAAAEETVIRVDLWDYGENSAAIEEAVKIGSDGVYVEKTFRHGEALGTRCALRFLCTGTHGDVDLMDVKLEEGNKATAWSMSPADDSAQYDRLAAELTVQAGRIAANATAAQTAQNTANGAVESISAVSVELDAAKAEINLRAYANQPSIGVDTTTGESSSVNVKITSEKFEVDVPGEDGDFLLNETGGKLPVLVGEDISAPNVARRFAGAETMYVKPDAMETEMAAGNCYRSLTDACTAMRGRNLERNLVVQVLGDTFGEAALNGICGQGSVTVNGNGHSLTGFLHLGRNTADIIINNLKIIATGQMAAEQLGPGYVEWGGCTFRGTGEAGSYGLRTDRHAGAFLYGCGLYNAERLLSAGKTADVVCNGLKGSGTYYLHGDGGSVKWFGTRPDGALLMDHPVVASPADLSALSVERGEEQPEASDVATKSYNYLYSDSYANSWGVWEDGGDIRQGYDGRMIYGVIWFDAAAIRRELADRTIKQASLRLYMMKGVGRGVAVEVQLWGTNTAYSGRSGAPVLTTEYGTIGRTQPGEINEITIPAQAIADIANGATQALVLKSSDTELYKGREYSKNYARFSGSGTANEANGPRLTVVYQ